MDDLQKVVSDLEQLDTATVWDSGALVTLSGTKQFICSDVLAQPMLLVLYNASQTDQEIAVSVQLNNAKFGSFNVPGTTGNQGLATAIGIDGAKGLGSGTKVDNITIQLDLGADPQAEINAYLLSAGYPRDGLQPPSPSNFMNTAITQQDYQSATKLPFQTNFERFYFVPPSRSGQILVGAGPQDAFPYYMYQSGGFTIQQLNAPEGSQGPRYEPFDDDNKINVTRSATSSSSKLFNRFGDGTQIVIGNGASAQDVSGGGFFVQARF